MSEDKKARAKERATRLIRELQKKTEENGCSEAEALSAAEKIGQLMEEHDIDLGEIGIKEEGVKATQVRVFAADDYAGTLVTGIKRFCSLIAYLDTNYRGAAACYVLFGLPHDLELATYLYEICCEAMDEDWARFMERNGYSIAKRQSFRLGFATRVYERLKLMKEERDQRTYVKTGTALVVVKDAVVKQEFDKLGISLRKTGPRVARDNHAFAQGHAAGGRLNLNNPIGSRSADARLR